MLTAPEDIIPVIHKAANPRLKAGRSRFTSPQRSHGIRDTRYWQCSCEKGIQRYSMRFLHSSNHKRPRQCLNVEDRPGRADPKNRSLSPYLYAPQSSIYTLRSTRKAASLLLPSRINLFQFLGNSFSIDCIAPLLG